MASQTEIYEFLKANKGKHFSTKELGKIFGEKECYNKLRQLFKFSMISGWDLDKVRKTVWWVLE